MSTTIAQEKAFAAQRAASISQRTHEIAAAEAAFAGDQATIDRAVRSANRCHMQRVVSAASTNGMNAANAETALRGYIPQVAEIVNATDDSIFVLEGGIYDVTIVSATFGADPAGVVTLVGRGGNVLASFTEPGTVPIEAPYGSFRFVLSNVSDLVAQITSAAY